MFPPEVQNIKCSSKKYLENIAKEKEENESAPTILILEDNHF